MVPSETGRREFLFGAGTAGVGASAEAGRLTAGLGASAVGIADLRANHRVRWQFDASDDEDALVYPFTSVDGTVFAFVHRSRSDAETRNAVYAIDMATGETRWKQATNDFPVVRATPDGLVYVRGQRGVRALDATDGSVKWRYQQEESHLRELTVTNGTAITAFRNGLVALDAADGSERWRIPVGSNSPRQEETSDTNEQVRGLTVAGDGLYLGTTDAFIAISLADGEQQWQVPIEEDVAWPAAVRDGLLVGWSNGAVYGIETADGSRRFRTPVENARVHDIGGTVGEHTAYVWGDRLTAVDIRTGGKRWTYTDDEGAQTDADGGQGFLPIVSDGRVYTSAGKESVVALDADSGRERWQFDANIGFGYWGEVAGGYVYVTGEQRIYVFDAETGRETWSLEVGDDSTTTWVSALGDFVFAGTRSGRLYAIDPPSRLATAPVETATEFATSSPGLGLLGLLGAGLLGVGYRRVKRRASAGDLGANADLELGRLERLDDGPVTETHLKRVQTPDGPQLVAETQLAHSATDRRTQSTFREAVEKWAELETAGILPIWNHGTDPAPWFETPFLAGGSLADSWPLTYRERIEVASAVARTLHAAHCEGVAHGRLGPRHVLRDAAEEHGHGVGDPEVRVGGWFLADALAEAHGGSDPYAPPENRSDNERSVSGDVYRVGALACHLVTGELPNSGSGSEVNHSSHALPSNIHALPSELDAVLNRALAAGPENRYDSALAFDDDFRWAALDR